MCKQLRATHWGRSEWVLRCETVLNNNIINCENHGLWQLMTRLNNVRCTYFMRWSAPWLSAVMARDVSDETTCKTSRSLCILIHADVYWVCSETLQTVVFIERPSMAGLSDWVVLHVVCWQSPNVRARRDSAFENASLMDNWDDAEGYYSEWPDHSFYAHSFAFGMLFTHLCISCVMWIMFILYFGWWYTHLFVAVVTVVGNWLLSLFCSCCH